MLIVVSKNMNYIKKGNKYYKIEKEVSVDEINERKATLTKHLDTLEERRQEFAKKEKEKVIKAQEGASLELDELNKL